MAKLEERINAKRTHGDVAVSGLLNGLLGGLAMAAVILAFSVLDGHGASYLGYFSTGTPVLPMTGLVMHLAVSAIYGILYALVRRFSGLDRLAWLPAWLAGPAYAMGLWVFAILVLLPATNSLILTLPWVVFLTGHVAYGLVLGVTQKP